MMKTNTLKILLFLLLIILLGSGCSAPGYAAADPGLQPASILSTTESTFRVVVLIIMLFGLFSLVTQVIPGLIIIWLSALVYGVVTGFTWVSILIFAVITALMIFGSIVDELLMGTRAHKSGASWLTIVLAIVAGVLGSIQFPPFGGLIAALLVLFALESMRLKDWRKAFSTTREMAIGCGYAFFARFGIGILMILLWGLWIYFQ